MSIKGSYIFKANSDEESAAFIQKALDEDYYGYAETVLDYKLKQIFKVDEASLFMFEFKMESMASATVFSDCLMRLKPAPDFWCFAEQPPMQFLRKFAGKKDVVSVMFGNPRGGNPMEDGAPYDVVTKDYPLWKEGLPEDLHFGRLDKLLKQYS